MCVAVCVVSQPYIDMTLALMAKFGVDVKCPATGVYEIPNSGYDNPAVQIHIYE